MLRQSLSQRSRKRNSYSIVVDIQSDIFQGRDIRFSQTVLPADPVQAHNGKGPIDHGRFSNGEQFTATVTRTMTETTLTNFTVASFLCRRSSHPRLNNNPVPKIIPGKTDDIKIPQDETMLSEDVIERSRLSCLSQGRPYPIRSRAWIGASGRRISSVRCPRRR